jgi:hypothetical protein
VARTLTKASLEAWMSSTSATASLTLCPLGSVQVVGLLAV